MLDCVALMLLATSVAATSDCALHSTACPSDPLSGFVRRHNATLVNSDGTPLRKFSSINVPNLHRIELSEGGVRAPTEFEVADLLCSIRQMGASVSRIYVLSHGSSPDFHVVDAQLTESWMVVLDQVLALAHEFGVRLIIPFVNTHWIQSWGSTAYYAEWAGQPKAMASEFFHDAAQRAVFKQVLEGLLTRTNTLTGRRYADEPAILAWELGNELHDVRFGHNSTVPPPREWSEVRAAAERVSVISPATAIL